MPLLHVIYIQSSFCTASFPGTESDCHMVVVVGVDPDIKWPLALH